MKPDRFKELLDELDGNSLQTLKEKNARYAKDGDCLHNFRSGAEIAGGTPAQACWGYVTKHLVALRDMIDRNDFSNREDFLEKCQDTINYVRFLWCIGNDGVSEKENNEIEEPKEYWWYKPKFPAIENADIFVNEMKRIFRDRGGLVTRADVLKYCGDVTTGNDRCYGWCTLNKWKITTEEDMVRVYIPQPVDIEHLL